MIAYIKGTLAQKGESFLVVEAGGIGYYIHASTMTISGLPETGQEVKLHTYMNVKEDGISLFGFSSLEELTLFHKLITVNGVGPKGALSFLAVLKPTDIMIAILSGDTATLCKAPGIGKKTAQRMILELKDKLNMEDSAFFGQEEESNSLQMGTLDPKWEAAEALAALGYSKSEAIKAVKAAYEEGMDTEELLKLALKKMVRN